MVLRDVHSRDAAAMFESFLEELEGFMQDADKLDDMIHQILAGRRTRRSRDGWSGRASPC